MLAERLLKHDVRDPDPRPSGRPVPRPFIKWVGGKSRLLSQYESLVPSSWERYFEPFAGGAAMYWHYSEGHAVLNDLNRELVTTYRVVRDDVEALIAALRVHYYDKDYYYSVRAQDPDELTPVEQAARMIFLNRTGFNGLYRVNKSGRFNVPFGRYSNPKICDPHLLRGCSEHLKDTDLRSTDFASAVADAGEGDFVYFDPPYAPVSSTSDFTGYCAGGFDNSEQQRLRDLLVDLDARGVRFMLSNSDAPGLAQTYAKAGWDVVKVRAGRSINCNKKRRGKVPELVVRNLGRW